MNNAKIRKGWFLAAVIPVLLLLLAVPAFAVEDGAVLDTSQYSNLDVLFFLTLLSLLPSILMMMTCFTRIIIVLSFLRNALGLQQTPPNMILIGIAIFLSLFIMNPVVQDIKANAYDPYVRQEITQQQALKEAERPMKEFMLKQTQNDDLKLFLGIAKLDSTQNLEDVPMHVVIPAFITSELKRAFTMGFLLFIPFIIIDLLVASILMSMGMVMLPPAMISLPFKILLFIMVDGWGFLFKSLVTSFHL